jgi:predicted oxidoreductase (fatty acid repression mutant protein)
MINGNNNNNEKSTIDRNVSIYLLDNENNVIDNTKQNLNKIIEEEEELLEEKTDNNLKNNKMMLSTDLYSNDENYISQSDSDSSGYVSFEIIFVKE